MIAAWSGLLLGLAGSAHCAAMCGPFAAAAAPRGVRAAAHHFSRIGVYAVLGAGSGAMGSVAVDAGAGRVLSTLVALALLAQAAFRWNGRGIPDSGGRLTAPLVSTANAIRRRAVRHPVLAAAGAGMVNGLLPCGLVYTAVVGSLGFGGPIHGAIFMTAFGAATMPALFLAVRLAGIATSRRPALKQLAPAAILVVAILIAIRGWAVLPLQVHSH